jgi:hypothetical protein
MGSPIDTLLAPIAVARNIVAPKKAPDIRIPARQAADEKPKQVLQSAKSRAARLAASRGRRSFRISLGTDGAGADGAPRATRSGLTIG